MAGEKDLLNYFIDQTNKQLSDMRQEVKTEIHSLHARFDDLNTFKIGIQIDAKWRTLIYSSLCGVVTLAASLGCTIYLSKLERATAMDAARIELKGNHP